MTIRTYTALDADVLNDLYLHAFGTEEGDEVAQLVRELHAEESVREMFSLVAEEKSEVVGHVIFSPTTIVVDDSKEIESYILAPLAVAVEHQKQGIGSGLVRHGFDLLKEKGIAIVHVYGDPAYYSRFGFKDEGAGEYTPPYKMQYPHGWLVLSLEENSMLPPGGKLKCMQALSKAELW